MTKPTKESLKTLKQSISGSENIFDRKEIIAKQHILRRLYETYKGTDEIEYFAKLKFKDVMYEVGDYIQLETTLSQADFYVAKLTKVIRSSVKDRLQAFVEVEWVLRKNDLPENLLRLYADYISTAEVFPSNEKFYLYIAAIRCKCIILSIEEYGQLANAPESVLFSRSRYNSQNKTLEPDPSTWNSDCFCRKPNNPDLQYVECEKCNRWFHKDCVQSKIINNEFLCSGCFGSARGMMEMKSEKW